MHNSSVLIIVFTADYSDEDIAAASDGNMLEDRFEGAFQAADDDPMEGGGAWAGANLYQGVEPMSESIDYVVCTEATISVSHRQ